MKNVFIYFLFIKYKENYNILDVIFFTIIRLLDCHILYFTNKILNYQLIFSDHGKIIKAVNAESADSNKKVSSVVIEELDVLAKNEPIRNLEIVRTTQYGKLLIYIKYIFHPKFHTTKKTTIL